MLVLLSTPTRLLFRRDPSRATVRSLIGAWRLWRAVLHLLLGMVIIRLRFGAYSQGQRDLRIGWWSAKLVKLLGLRIITKGEVPPMTRVLVVANHVSWLDIPVIHAVLPQARFVSKADVLRWPLIGALISGAGTLFIERERKRDALRVMHRMAQALNDGQAVAVFPEGTVSDGAGLLPFHANLLQAAVSTQANVLPVVLRFSEEQHALSEAVQYLDNTTLLGSAWRIVCTPRTTVTITMLPIISAQGLDRRALAEAARTAMANALRAAGSAR
jgi:1-acyl-sn-glycerol-3-phosphate acyltransferase